MLHQAAGSFCFTCWILSLPGLLANAMPAIEYWPNATFGSGCFVVYHRPYSREVLRKVSFSRNANELFDASSKKTKRVIAGIANASRLAGTRPNTSNYTLGNNANAKRLQSPPEGSFSNASSHVIPCLKKILTFSSFREGLGLSLHPASDNYLSSESSSYYNPSPSKTVRDCGSSSSSSSCLKPVHVTLGVLLPFLGDWPFVVCRVAPALELALDSIVTKLGPWTFDRLTIRYADSGCDTGVAMSEAIVLREHLRSDVFLGPVCDFAVAPVARQARYWNMPVISVGATAWNFFRLKHTRFSHLTRLGPAYLESLAGFLVSLFQEFDLHKFKVLYEYSGQDNSLDGFCYFLASYLNYHFMDMGFKIQQDYYRLDQGRGIETRFVLVEEIGIKYPGESYRERNADGMNQ